MQRASRSARAPPPRGPAPRRGRAARTSARGAPARASTRARTGSGRPARRRCPPSARTDACPRRPRACPSSSSVAGEHGAQLGQLGRGRRRPSRAAASPARAPSRASRRARRRPSRPGSAASTSSQRETGSHVSGETSMTSSSTPTVHGAFAASSFQRAHAGSETSVIHRHLPRLGPRRNVRGYKPGLPGIAPRSNAQAPTWRWSHSSSSAKLPQRAAVQVGAVGVRVGEHLLDHVVAEQTASSAPARSVSASPTSSSTGPSRCESAGTGK